MSQPPSATFSIGFSGVSSIPPKPTFQDIQFKVIGQEPALLMRFSNSQADDFDIDDIYEDPPVSSSATDMAVESLPSLTRSRPTLLQSLAGGIDLTGPDDSSTTITSTDLTPPNISTVASPLAISDPRCHTSSTISLSRTTFSPVSPSNTIRESLTRPSTFPSTDLILPSSDHNNAPHQAIDNAKTFKKVVALKDKFMTVSSTARQSQRFAKQALINAQRSAAAAQSCLVAAESFVPSIKEVISAIHRMELATAAPGSSSDWVALLRDLKDGLRDLEQWSSVDANDSSDGSLGRNSLLLQNPSPPPSPPSLLSGTISRVSSTGFLLTSVEEEAQQALRAWNQLDQQIHETDDPSRESGSLSGPEPLVQNTQPPRPETELESPRRQEKERPGVSDEERHETETLQGGRQKSVEAEATMQMALTEAARISEPKGGSRVEQNQGLRQQRTKEVGEASTGPQDDDAMVISTAAIGDVGDVASRQTLPEHHQPGSSLAPSQKSTAAGSKNQDVSVLHQDAHNLQSALAKSIVTEQTRTSASNISSSKNMQAEQGPVPPPSFSPAVVRVAPNATPAGRARLVPSVSPNAANNSGEKDKNSVVKPKQLEDCSLSIKAELVELKMEAEEKKLVESAVLVKSDVDDTLVKQEPESPKVPLSPESSANESGISSRILPPVPGPLREDISSVSQKRVEQPSPATGPVKVTPTLHSSHPKVVINDAPSAQPTSILVAAHPPASPSVLSLPSQQPTTPAWKAQPPPAPVRLPISNSAIPVPLGVVARSTYTQDPDDPISPDLTSSRSWAADKQVPNRGRREVPDRAVLRRSRAEKKANNGSPSQAKGRPASSNPRNLPLQSPNRRPIQPSGEPPASLIGKKRLREEESHPGPSSERREWRGAPSLSQPEMVRIHIPTEPRARTNANAPLTTSVTERGQNSSNSQHPGASLMHRLDAASPATAEVPNQPEPRTITRILHPPPQQAQQSRHRGYDSYRPSYPQGYNRAPELIYRIQDVQQGDNMLDHGHSNISRGVNRPPRSRGRGRGNDSQLVALQQSVLRKTPLIERMGES